jgi:hypothetical protein
VYVYVYRAGKDESAVGVDRLINRSVAHRLGDARDNAVLDTYLNVLGFAGPGV